MIEIKKENAKKYVEIMKLDEDKVAKRVYELEKDLKELREAEAYTGSVSLVGHNTILGYKRDEELVFVVDTSTDRNLKMLSEVDRYLSVPRYEPKTAKKWLSEPMDLTMGEKDEDYSEYSKVAIGERELRQAVIVDKERALDHWKRSLEILNIAKEA